MQKNNIGIAKHTDGKIEYKSLNDGKLICTDDGDKMKIHQKDMSPENVKFFLEVSIDRYGNELQINGKKEFKDMVVEAAAANNLPVILKPAELQEQLMARRKELELEQKVEVDNSIEKAAPEQAQEKAKNEQSSSIEPVQNQTAANDEFKQPQAAEPLKADMTQEQAQAAQELVTAYNRQEYYQARVPEYEKLLEQARIDVEKQLNGTLDHKDFVERCEKEPILKTTYNEVLEIEGLKTERSLDTLQKDPQFSRNYYEQIESSILKERAFVQAVKNDVDGLANSKIKIADIAGKLQDPKYKETFKNAINDFNRSTKQAKFDFNSVVQIAEKSLMKRNGVKIEFDFNKSVSTQAGKTSYTVKIDGVPAQEAIKQKPELSKMLDNVALHKDMQAKGISAESLKSGIIQPKQLDNELKVTKPKNMTVDLSGKPIEKAKSTAKSSNLEL